MSSSCVLNGPKSYIKQYKTLRPASHPTEHQTFVSTACGAAVRRHRLIAQANKLHQHVESSQSPVPLGERAQVFADALTMALRKSNINSPPILETRYACRSLSGFALPPSAGLKQRPILFFQGQITDEVRRAAVHTQQGDWASLDPWHSSWFPHYDNSRPQPLWRRLRPLCLLIKATHFVSTAR